MRLPTMALLSAESVRFDSPGRSPGDIEKNCLALKGRNSLASVSPLQGCTREKRALLPRADESRPFGAEHTGMFSIGMEILQPRPLSPRVVR